jgi:transposase
LESQLADLEHHLLEALQPHEAALQLLMTIPGIDRLAAAKLVVEIGVDMAAFGTAGRLCKWAGVCPGNDESAGKRRRSDTAPGNRYVRALLCQIAWAAVRTTSQFKGRFQSLVSRRGTKKAIVAIGHKVLKTVFVLLSRQVPYQDSTVDYEALVVKRNAPRSIRQLKKFGYLTRTA